MASTLEHLSRSLRDPASARRSRSARIGRVLAGRRAVIFAPLFVVGAALALLRPAPPPQAIALGGGALVLLAYALRIWATGYRTWVRGSGGARHLMRAGPYAHVRHPLYVANGVAGAAALVALGRFELLLLYVPLYAAVIACIVAREEEALAERYGPLHATYRATVPSFVPVPGRSLPRAERTGEFCWGPIATGAEVWKLLGVVAALAYFVMRVRGLSV